MNRRKMIRLLLFLMGALCVPENGLCDRNRKRELKTRGTVVYEKTHKCLYACTCPMPDKDICGNCKECPRQLDEPCDEEHLCDVQKGLICQYKHNDSEGICKELKGTPCIVYNKTYEHGETFMLDCRTQCSCQNGTYGCSSLCPQEHISPKGSCQHPQLVEIPGQCCREWMCDSQNVKHPPSCQPFFSKWSPCTSICGAGLSSRKSNLNAECLPDSELRICQTRPCQQDSQTTLDFHRKQHHLRKGHECKATHRLSTPVYLQFGPCRSRKRFRPKYCGLCPIQNIACEPVLSTTVKVEFVCDGGRPTGKQSDFLPDFLESGIDLWNGEGPEQISVEPLILSVQWVLKCRCKQVELPPTSSTGEIILHRVHRTAAP